MRDITKTLCYRRFKEVWNEAQEQAIDTMLSSDCFAHGINAEDGPKGVEGFKLFYQNFRKQFSAHPY